MNTKRLPFGWFSGHRSFNGFMIFLLLSVSSPGSFLSSANGTCNAQSFTSATHQFNQDKLAGKWSAQLKSPGGQIGFEIQIEKSQSGYAGWILNGTERIRIEKLTYQAPDLEIHFPHYDSRVLATLKSDSKLEGKWTKFVGKTAPDEMKFSATRGERKFKANGCEPLTGRYEVKFESSKDKAVGIFKKQGSFLSGTFLTTTGDYRYLAGNYDAATDTFDLSCFDGGHAFLFKAKRAKNGDLTGDFWSRNSWHEKWTATRNETAKLDDGFKQVEWTGIATSQLSFPDEDGKQWNLTAPKFSGKVKILQIFGSWCPNCHDASVFMNELNRDYREQGLSIVGLAFELSADAKHRSKQIKRYRERTKASYPILIAGLADKTEAARSLRILSKVKSYPTTIFLDQNDRPLAIHSGFSGPATGKAHQELKEKFRLIIERQLR